MRRTALLISVLAAALLAGCDLLGIESPEKISAARDADGKAIGGACRHAGRAIEDCYSIYKKSERAAIFAGWRDMNDYMRENKIEPVLPQLTAQVMLPKPAAPALKPAPDPAPAAEQAKTVARPKAAAAAKPASGV